MEPPSDGAGTGWRVELKWLEDFLAFTELGSFSRAAARRNVTQPAFGRRIRALEHWVGAPLVDRSAYPPGLTDAGRQFREVAAELVRESHRVRRELSGRRRGDAEVVGFAAPHFMALGFFPGWLAALKRELGDFRATMHCDTVHDCVQRLLAGDCHFYLGLVHPEIPLALDPEAWLHLELGNERLLPWSSADERGQPRYRVPGSAGRLVPVLGYGPGSFLQSCVDRHVAALEGSPHLELVFESAISEVLKMMCVDGHGVVWLPQSCVHEHDRARGLVPAGDESWHVDVGRRLYRSARSPGALATRIWEAAATRCHVR